jgi:hypothetical protein
MKFGFTFNGFRPVDRPRVRVERASIPDRQAGRSPSGRGYVHEHGGDRRIRPDGLARDDEVYALYATIRSTDRTRAGAASQSVGRDFESAAAIGYDPRLRRTCGREPEATMSDPLVQWLNEEVVLDTATPIVYIGRLIEVGEHTFVLDSADMHDCRDGHAKKEHYLAEVKAEGVAVNRRCVVVMRSVVISVSRLQDVVIE